MLTAFFKHPSFQEFVLNDRLSNVIEAFIKGTPLLLADQILMKPPHHGGPKPYHQDNFYFAPDDPEALATALDEATHDAERLELISLTLTSVGE